MKIHKLLLKKINNWKELEKQIEELPTTKVKGDVFEQFVYIYFNLNKTLYQISEVYMEKNIPLKYKRKFNLEKKDCGVDGLIIHHNGTTSAYQVKFRKNREKPSYDELAKFWVEAKNTDYHLTVANCYTLSRLCVKHKKHLSILVDEFESLGKDFFNEFYELVNTKTSSKKFFEPFDFQKRMIKNVVEGFKSNDRGKLIAACGTGKTFTALRITEAMQTRKILFIAPSLALIKQTLESWAEQSLKQFSFICVCSDKTVSDEVDMGDILPSDLNVPVTTSSDKVSNYLSQNDIDKKIVFSTYQSLDVIAKAVEDLKEFTFDIAIFDEAHRTAGSKNSGLFSLGLNDKYIRIKKRLFMTATERLLRPWIVKKAQEYNRIVFSMDDESIYGPVFDRFNFGEAINKNVISDYKIIVAGVEKKEVYDLIKKDKFLTDNQEDAKEYYTSAQNIFRQVMLIKAMQELPIKKVLTFHNTVKSAYAFINGVGSDDLSFKKILDKIGDTLEISDFYLDHVNGTMPAGERREILDLFQDSKYGIISNARCLTEGVDVPLIDSIYFVNPKRSLIDIVQACGRALRKPFGSEDKVAFFIVPILIPEGKVEAEIVNEIDFEMLHNIVQSLREQDLRLAEWINNINLNASKGKTYNFSKSTDSPIVLKIPENINIKDFEKSLYLRIAEVNGEPTRYTYKTKEYGKKERKSDYKRIFKTLGDYSFESYRDKLVIPTIEKYNLKEDSLSMKEIKVNHNNVSHTRRLGLVQKVGEKYELTALGVQLFENKLSFHQIFKGQMLRYYNTVKEKDGKRLLFPYRACLKILLELKCISYIEFVFGLYSMVDYSEESISESVEGIKYIRQNYPNIEILNEENKAKVLEELNDHFGTNFTLTDIWEKKTTIYNQFIYFRNHLSLFDDCISSDKKGIYLKENSEGKLVGLLMKDKSFENESDEKKLRKGYIKDFVKFIVFSF